MLSEKIEQYISEKVENLKDELKKEVEEMVTNEANKTKTVWDLKKEDGEEYYRLYSDGDVAKLSFDSYYDEKSREAGNAFLTEEEAKFEAERREIEAIMKKYSRPFKSGEANYEVVCDTENKMVFVSVAQFHNSGVPVFVNKEVAEKAIDEIREDRLKKYWFGVTK